MLLNILFSGGASLLVAAALALVKQALLESLIASSWVFWIAGVVGAIALGFWGLWFYQSPNTVKPVTTFLLILLGLFIGLSS